MLGVVALADYYRRQFAWRDWPRMFEVLPDVRGRTVLDLGCGVGDLAAELVARGARVIGIDANEELVAAARALKLERADFRVGDLRALPELGREVDGIWCSFAAAYFVDFESVLRSWTAVLRPGGWVALTEVDDLFGHEPLGAEAREVFERYADEALRERRYDFRMGRRLSECARRAGLRVEKELELADRELAFDGAAEPEVLQAWRDRLEGLRLLREKCGARFDALRDEFLACLGRPDHRSRARVLGSLAGRSVESE